MCVVGLRHQSREVEMWVVGFQGDGLGLSSILRAPTLHTPCVWYDIHNDMSQRVFACLDFSMRFCVCAFQLKVQ